MRSLKFSTEQVKAMHKFLQNLSISTLESSKLNKEEQENFWTVYGAFACENDEISLDESSASIEEH